MKMHRGGGGEEQGRGEGGYGWFVLLLKFKKSRVVFHNHHE